MRKLSIKSNLKAFIGVLTVIALVLAIAVSAFTLVSIPNKNDSLAGNPGDNTQQGNAAPVAEGDLGEIRHENLTSEQVNGLSAGTIPYDHAAYVSKMGYTSTQAINTEQELKDWITNPSGGTAYLNNDITFSWNNFGRGYAPFSGDGAANIDPGEVLDGCGKTINIITNYKDGNVGETNHYFSLFLNAVFGTIKNVNFTYSQQGEGTYKLWASKNSQQYVYMSPIVAVLGKDDASAQKGVMENCSMTMLPGKAPLKLEVNSARWSASSGQQARLRFGFLTGHIRNGVVRNCSLNFEGGEIQPGGNGDWFVVETWKHNAYVGGITGMFGHSSSYASEIYNVSVYGTGTKVDFWGAIDNDQQRNVGFIASEISSNASSSSVIQGAFIDAAPDIPSCKNVQLFVGQANNGVEFYNGKVLSKVDTKWAGEIAIRIPESYDVFFAKPDPVTQKDISIDDFKNNFNRIILRDNTPRNPGEIIWSLKAEKRTGTDTTELLDEFNVYSSSLGLIQAGPDTYISMPSKLNNAGAGVKGNPIEFTYGERYYLNNITASGGEFNGYEHAANVEFINGSGNVVQGLHPNTLYNNGVNAPIVPGTYNITVVDATNNKFSYLDTANKKVAAANSEIYETMNITKAAINIASIVSNGIPYDSNKYTADPLQYTLAFNTASVNTSGIRIKYQQVTSQGVAIGDWTGETDGLTISIAPPNGYNIGDVYYRMVLEKADSSGIYQLVSEYTVPVTFLYDDFTPIAEYTSTYEDGTWHTDENTNIIVTPTATGRYAAASAMYAMDPDGSGKDLEWKIATTVEDPNDGYIKPGFMIDTGVSGIIYFWVKAEVLDTGRKSLETRYMVKIDVNDYAIGYDISMMDGTPAKENIVSSDARETYKRDQTANLKFTTSVDDYPYYIASVNGLSADGNVQEFNYEFKIADYFTDADAVGGADNMPADIEIKLRKAADITINALPLITYGDNIVLPEGADAYTARGLIDESDKSNIVFNSKFKDSSIDVNARLSIGDYDITADAEHDNYVFAINGTVLTIKPYILEVDYDTNAYRFTRDLFVNTSDNAVIELLGLKFKSDKKPLDGDVVNIDGILYTTLDGSTIEKSEISYGIYFIKATVDNANYEIQGDEEKPSQQRARIMLSKLAYDNDKKAYMVTSAEDFLALNEPSFTQMLSQKFILTQNIDMSAHANPMITSKFSGSFNGQGYYISNIFITTYDANACGLFTNLDNATIDSVYLDGIVINAYIPSGASDASVGMLGANITNSVIKNFTVRGEVRVTAEAAEIRVGGIAGFLNSTRIDNIDVISNIDVITSGSVYVGQIAGESVASAINGADLMTLLHANSASTAKAGYIFGADSGQSSSTLNNIYYLNGSADIDNNRIEAHEGEGYAACYAEDYDYFVNEANIKALVKALIDTRYFGDDQLGTTDSPFVVTNYNQLLAMDIYPYATFRLASNIYCHKINAFDPERVFGNVIFDDTDIDGNAVEYKVYDYMGETVLFGKSIYA